MTASGATSLNVYPQEDEEKNPVCFVDLKVNDGANLLRSLAHY